MMNLNSLKEKLLKSGENIALQVDEETATSLSVHTEITAKKFFKNSVYLRIVVFPSGTLHMFLTFDEIERTYDNLYLINAFNEANPWFRAYIANINDKDFLELHYSAINLENEEQVVDSIGYLLNELLREDTIKHLKSIIETVN